MCIFVITEYLHMYMTVNFVIISSILSIKNKTLTL